MKAEDPLNVHYRYNFHPSESLSRPCFDIDECELRSHDCEGNQECENLDGSFNCKCSTGFIQNNNDVSDNAPACMDYDECSHGEHECSPDGTCTNSFGSYACKCNTGFSGDGFECFNSDECTRNSHQCDPLANCFDTKVSLTNSASDWLIFRVLLNVNVELVTKVMVSHAVISTSVKTICIIATCMLIAKTL